ncbi:MAG TPA: NAD(P)/FAD-dependent oxidoreductase, partial [Caldimonas sp.]|nr:NAD(P)/FAD-dependent oxidoreductase [Caldimonas sp.]
RYPGVRADSDMYTLAYSFRPWRQPRAIVDGATILSYLQDTARENGIEERIRYGHRVTGAAWSTADARWTVEARCAESDQVVRFSCNFLFACSGYYRYAAGHAPEIAGRDHYRGRVVHPQHWSDDIDHAGRRVAVIGSGATAMSLVPAIAATASHVTMVQRSPTWVISQPADDRLARRLARFLPDRLAYTAVRWQRVLMGVFFFALCRGRPALASRLLTAGVRARVGPQFDIATHFAPRYKPWEQRLCLVPDGDFFRTLRSGRASIVTSEIERFTETGLRLRSGDLVDADLVVMATGLELELLGGIAVSVDGRVVDWASKLTYKGMMYDGVPNFASVFGYANASWTLRSDLISGYVCRLLQRMNRRGLRQCTPRNSDPGITTAPWLDLSSGYIRRAAERLPKQGSRAPWSLCQNYLRDLAPMRWSRLDDGAMVFSNPGGRPPVASAPGCGKAPTKIVGSPLRDRSP